MVKQPYLPEGKDVKYAGMDNPWMQAAKGFSRIHSTDRQMPTGCVIVKEAKIIGQGANQVPLKSPFFMRVHRDYFCTRRILGIPSGQKYWLCPGCSSAKNHAEGQATRNVRKLGNDARGADAYLWGHWWACETCWNALLSAGVEDLYLLEDSEVLFNRDMPGNVVGRQFE